MSPVEIWRGAGLSIGADRILRVQGYSDPGRVRPAIVRAAEAAASRAAAFAAPEARLVRAAIEDCAGPRLVLAGGFAFECPVFGEVLDDCDEALVFVLTLGPALEDEIAGRQSDEPLDAFLLDSAGWLLVEQAQRQLRADLTGRLDQEGRAMSARLGPGYDYRDGETRARWPLEQQHELFRVFGDAALPVALLDSSAMLPRMSRSGLFGIGRRR